MPGKAWREETEKLKGLVKSGADKQTVRAALPNRTWNAIRIKMTELGIYHEFADHNTTPAQDIATEVERQDTDAIKKKYRRVVRERAFQDRVIHELHEAIIALPPAPKTKKLPTIKRTGAVEGAVLVISDLHVGEVVSSDEMSGLGQYDFKTFCAYSDFLGQTTVDIIGRLRHGFNIKRLWTPLLGDMVTGMIHAELEASADVNPLHAAMGGAFVFAQMYRDWAPHFERIDVPCVVGNHGRLTQKKRYKQKYVNWDYVFYTTLMLLLKNEPTIHFDIPFSFFHRVDVLGHQHLLMHGDDIRSFYGIPWYGIKRTVGNLTEIFAAQGDYPEYVLLGHFHNKGTLDRYRGEIILNGSWPGGNEFSLQHMHATNEPKQVMYGIHPDKGKTWEFSINFRHARGVVTEPRYTYNPDAQLACQIQELES
jgi:hypothetical protein